MKKMMGAAALTVLALTACGSDSLDMDSAQQQVADVVEDSGLDRPDSVDCSGQLSISAGASALCSLHYEDQTDQTAEVTVSRVGSDGIGLDVNIVDR